MRKLGLISSLWAALLLFPLTGFALGLGEIEASSYLNQPLKAEIQVNSARPGEIDNLLISLASRDAFRKAGLERPAGLSKLKFKVEKSEDGQKARILVTTKTAIKEPFLSFLVEADWAKGRLLREFTILLDPLSFAQQAAPAAPQVSPEQPELNKVTEAEPVAKESGSIIQRKNDVQSSTQVIATPIAIATPSNENEVPYVADTEYLAPSPSVDQVVVSKGDTLWGIAAQFKDDGHSMAQVMLAMQMLNPDAFSQDNINNLKVGAVLRVPDMDVMDRLSKQEAYAQVLDQNGLWDEYVARKSGSTSNAIADASSGIGSSQQETDTQLNLLTAEEGDSESASLQNDANSENSGQIRKQLALAEEELEAARLENSDLKSRIEMLEQQQSKFEELEKLVQIQDNSLAQLQQATAEQAEVVADDNMVEEASVAQTETDELIMVDKPSEVMIEAAGEMLADDSMKDELTESSETASTDEMMDNVQSTEAETVLPTAVEGTDGMLTEEVAGPAPITTVPAPAIVTQTPESSVVDDILNMLPSTDRLLNDPIMLGGIGGFLVLLLGLVLLKRKKSTKVDEGITIEAADDSAIDLSADSADEDATPIHVPTTDQVSVAEDDGIAETPDIDIDSGMMETHVSEADEEDEFAATAIISAADMPEEETAAVQEDQDDVLNEVDVYLAYGLYDNAEDLLTETLQSSPERADYRAKILDTHFATKNKDAFVKEAEMLKSLGGAANRFWDRIQIMGFELAPENELFSGAKGSDVSVADLEYAKPESADFDIGSDDDVTDFSNTDFNLESDAFEISATQAISIPQEDDDYSETQSLEALDVDFPDLGETGEQEQVSNDSPDANAEEDLDLDETFNIGDAALDSEFGFEIDEGDDDEKTVEAELNIDFDIDDDEVSDETIEAELGIDFGIDDADIGDETVKTELDAEVETDDDDISFDLPDDLDDSAEDDVPAELTELEQTIEAPIALDDVPPMDDADGVDLNDTALIDFGLDDNEEDEIENDEVNETLILSAEELNAEMEKKAEELESEKAETGNFDVETPPEEGLDFNMSDIDDDNLQAGAFTPSDTVAFTGVNLDSGDSDDSSELKPADKTGDFDEFIAQATNEAAIDEVDLGAGLEKTGTFAPGDFAEEAAVIDEDTPLDVDGIDDIEDLMLPDDVDEVGTKLDLAKAFIDMGDAEGARSSLEEVLSEGTVEQKSEATGLIEQIS